MYNFKKRIGLAIGTANPNDEDIQNTATGLGGLILRSDLFDKIQAGANNNSLQNFDSFVVTNPDLVDEGIDVSGLRTTTPTRQELLSDIPEFSGIKFDPTQKNYVSDLYALYSGGLPSTSAPAVTTPVATTPSSTAGGGSGGGSQVTTAAPITTPTQPDSIGGFDPGVTPGPSGFIGLDPEYDVSPFEFDDYGTYDPPSSDSFLVSGAAGGASLKDIDLDQVDLGNPTGDPRIVPEEQETEGPPYGINPTTGRPYETPRTIADQNAVLGQTFEQQKDPGFWETARDNFVKTGEDIGGFFQDIKDKGFDVAEFAGTALLNLAGKALTGIPLLGTAASLIGGALPPRDPRQTALDEFYTTGAGAQYMDPSSPNYIPGMENYNIVSGSDTLNKLTDGRLIDETTYGLQEAYQDRIDTINESLNKFDKYNPNHPDYDPAKTKELTDRVKNLQEVKEKEKARLDLFSGDVDERDQMLDDISLQNKIDAGIQAAEDDSGSDMLDTTPTNITTNITSDQIDEFDTTPQVDTIPTSTGPIYNETTGNYEDAEGNVIDDPNVTQELLDEVTGADYKIGVSDRSTKAGLDSGFNPFNGDELTNDQKEEIKKGNYQKVIDELTGVTAKPTSLNTIDTSDDKPQDPGPSGFVGLDEDMDVDPFEFDDYGTYEPPAPPSPPTGTNRPGGDNRDDNRPSPSAPAKTSQGVTTSQFQALRDTGGGADRDPAPSRSVSTAGQAGPPSQRGGGGGGGGGGGSGGGRWCCSQMVHHGIWNQSQQFSRLTVWSSRQPNWWRSGYNVWGKVIAKYLLNKKGFWTEVMQSFYNNHVRKQKRTLKSTLADIIIYPGSFVCGLIWKKIPTKTRLAKKEELK